MTTKAAWFFCLFLMGALLSSGCGTAEPEKDWHRDYPTFWKEIKKAELRRPKSAAPSFFFPTQPGYAFAVAVGNRTYIDSSLTANETVHWEATFDQIAPGEESREITFTDTNQYMSKVENFSDKQGGAEYKVVFLSDPEATGQWEAIPKGTKTRFTGLLKKITITGDTPPGLLYSSRLTVENVKPETAPQPGQQATAGEG